MIVLTIIVCVIRSILLKMEHACIFFPNSLNRKKDYRHMLSNDHEIEEHNIIKKDVIINMIYYHNPSNKHVVLFAHGNSGHLYGRNDIFRFLQNLGSVVMFDYRGYGKSIGSPSENGIYEDIKEVWNYVLNNFDVKPSDIILYGESLGCVPVTWLAKYLIKKKKEVPKLIILQSGFSSLKDIVKDLYPKIVTCFLHSNLNNIENIKSINIPIIVAHSEDDEFIKITHAKKLMKCSNNIHFHKLTGDHNNPKLSTEYLNDIKRMLV